MIIITIILRKQSCRQNDRSLRYVMFYENLTWKDNFSNKEEGMHKTVSK